MADNTRHSNLIIELMVRGWGLLPILTVQKCNGSADISCQCAFMVDGGHIE